MDEYKPLTDPAVRAAVVRYLDENWPGFRSEHDGSFTYDQPRVYHGRPRPAEDADHKWLSEHHPLPRPRVPPPFDPVAADASLRCLGEARGGLVKFDPAASAAPRFRFVTDPVVFDIPGDEPLQLGRFRVDFWTDRLKPRPYLPSVFHEAVALTPRPALHRSDITHPHVSGKSICLGHAQQPFPAAFHAAQFDDAADYLAAVLRTYDEASPFVKLRNWRGHKCANCEGRSASHPNECRECHEVVGECCGTRCGNCGEAAHEGCFRNCDACDQQACQGCLNNHDGERVCTRCWRRCDGCDAFFDADDLNGDDRCDDCTSPSCSECGRAVDDEYEDLQDGECIRCAGRRCDACGERRWSDTLDDNDVCEDCQDQCCSDCSDSVHYEDLDDGVCRSCRTCTACDDVVESGNLDDGVCRNCRTCSVCEGLVDHDELDDDNRCLTCAPECSDCSDRTAAADLVGGRCPDCHSTHLEEMEEAADADAEAQV